MDYAKCAQEIFEKVGGRENLVSAAHCATRLRLVTVDNSKIDMKALENIDGVKGVFSNAGQLQLIIGTGTVNKVYDEFLAVSGMSAATKADVKAAAAAQGPLWRRIIKALGDVFVPILPAIVASGLMMGVVEGLGKLPGLGFADTGWYGFLDLIASTALAYLPVLVAVSAARVFGGNIFLGGVIGLSMINSGLLNAWNAGSADAINSFFGVTDGVIPKWILFGNFGVSRVGYQGHVIPVIIAVFIMSKLETKLHKVVPEMIDLFVTPLVTVFVTYFLTFTIIGPIFSNLETLVLNFFSWLVTVGFGIGALACGVIYPFTVVMGLHHMFNIIELGMLSSADFNNLNIWMPIASAANFAQFGACLAVGIKSHKEKTKSIAVPASMSASLGITEPAIFGVNLRYMKPLVCGAIAGGVGAMLGSLMGLGATANGVTGFPGYLIINSPLKYTIMLVVTFVIAFALSYMTYKDEEDEVPAEEAPAAEAKEEPVSDDPKFYAPVAGNAIDRDQIPDPTFASGLLGDGVGIEPTGEVVVAPFDGTVSSVVATKHAVAITGPKGMEVLIHVGVDTVKMEGDGFESFVSEGQKVKKGQKLLTFSLDKIKAAGYSSTVAVLVANAEEFPGFKVLKTGEVAEGDELLTVE